MAEAGSLPEKGTLMASPRPHSPECAWRPHQRQRRHRDGGHQAGDHQHHYAAVPASVGRTIQLLSQMSYPHSSALLSQCQDGAAKWLLPGHMKSGTEQNKLNSCVVAGRAAGTRLQVLRLRKRQPH